MSSKSRTDLRSCVPGAKFVKESDFDVKSRLAPPKSTEIDEKHVSDTEKIRRKLFLGVEKSKVANRLKRVLTKFDADRSHVRGVNGRSKFLVVASTGRAERKEFAHFCNRTGEAWRGCFLTQLLRNLVKMQVRSRSRPERPRGPDERRNRNSDSSVAAPG